MKHLRTCMLVLALVLGSCAPPPKPTPNPSPAPPPTALPTAAIPASLPSATAAPSPTTTIHVVEAGETLGSIAKRYGTSVEAIASANSIADINIIAVGQQLIIPVTSSGAAPTVEVATPLTALAAPAYTTEVDDVSLGRAVRFKVTAMIEFPVSVEQIESVCQEVVLELKEEKPLNAVVVFLYDTRSLLFAGYSIAKCEYAPRGEWGQAVNVQAGDYSTHEFVYEYQDKVHEPEQALSARPSEGEHKLAQEWDELSSKLIEEGGDPTAAEDIAFERVAQNHGMDVQSLRDVVLKVTAWTWR